MHFNTNKDRAMCASASTLISIRGQGLAQREDSLVTTLKPFDIISGKTDVLPKLGYGLFWLALFVASLGTGANAYAALPASEAVTPITCGKTITANVVVFDSPTVFNRLGAQNPNWITYALQRDVVVKSGNDAGKPLNQVTDLSGLAGNVELRSDKRPRPLVVRLMCQ